MILNKDSIDNYLVKIRYKNHEHEINPKEIHLLSNPFINITNSDKQIFSELVYNGNFVLIVMYIDDLDILYSDEYVCKIQNNNGNFGGKHELVILSKNNYNIDNEEYIKDIIKVKSIRRNI